MAPAEGRRRMNAAERRGLRQALAFDHRSGVIEPTILLAQMRHRRLGQRVEGAPATLAAKPQKPVRAAPADDCSARAMGTALGLHTLMAGRSKRVLAATTLAAPLRPSPRQIFRCSARLRPARLRQRIQSVSPLVHAHTRNRRKPRRKSSARIESTPRSDVSLNQTNS
jgi:hypothetical protein